MNKFIPVFACMFALAVCTVSAGETSVTESDLAGNKFILRQVDGQPFRGEPAPEVEFADDLSIHGKFCNGFRGKAELTDGVLTAERVVSTRMFCVDNDLSQLESRFLRLLDGGLAASMAAGRFLVLTGDGAELRFELATPVDGLAASLVGRKFILREVNGEPFSAERQPFIAFDETMRVSGSACNNFMGPGELKNGVLSVANAASTMMLCVDPKLSEFERDFHRALGEGLTVRLDGKTLTLAGGGMAMVYEEE